MGGDGGGGGSDSGALRPCRTVGLDVAGLSAVEAQVIVPAVLVALAALGGPGQVHGVGVNAWGPRGDGGGGAGSGGNARSGEGSGSGSGGGDAAG